MPVAAGRRLLYLPAFPTEIDWTPMGIRCLLYVSESCLSWPEDAAEVDHLVAVARRRNEQLSLTGALVYTRTHFAQVLEGDKAAIEEVMASIRVDPRHRNLCVVADDPLEARYF